MVVKYRTRFNDSLLPELVKESEYEFADGCINSPEKVVDMMRRIFSIDRETEEYNSGSSHSALRHLSERHRKEPSERYFSHRDLPGQNGPEPEGKKDSAGFFR